MQTRRQFLAATGALALAGCTGTGDGGGTTTTSTVGAGGALAFSTPAFEDGGTIPQQYSGYGTNVSPRLDVTSVPEGAATLALLVDDPDAGAKPFVHWLLWNVPADTDRIPKGVPRGETVASLDGARQGTNGFGELGYHGPQPPADDGPHTYRFTMFALGDTLSLAAGAKRGAFDDAVSDPLARARITGEYDR